MNIDGRRGIVKVVFVGSCRREFHDSRSNNKGAKALISMTEDFEVEEVSNRVAFRLFVGVDVDGIFHKTEDRRDSQNRFTNRGPQWAQGP